MAQRRFWQNLRQTLTEWRRDEGDLLAASFAYYAMIALFPLLIVLIAGTAAFFAYTDLGQDAEVQIFGELEDYVGEEFATDLGLGWSQIQNTAPINGPIGLLGLLLAAIPLFAQFERAFDRIWKVERAAPPGFWGAIRNILIYRLKAFVMLMGLGLLLVAIMIIGMLMQSLEVYSQALPAGTFIWSILRSASILMMNAAVFTLIYRVLPKSNVRLAEAALGGLLAAVTWEIGRQILAGILIGSRFNAYGAVGAILAVMLWIYYGATVLFFWAEYVQVTSERRGPMTLNQLARSAPLAGTDVFQATRLP